MFRIVRTLAALAAVALMTLAALVPAAAAGSSERPFHGVVVGEGGVIPDASCPIGLRTFGEATGTATHLGLTTMGSSHCTPNPPFGDPPGPIVGGEMTFVGANGDTLSATYTGTPDTLPPVEGAALSGQLHVIITGGTGRFDGASGEVEMPFWGTLHLESPITVTWAWAGTLGY